MQDNPDSRIPARTPFIAALLGGIAMAACGQLQAAPVLELGRAAKAALEPAKIAAQRARQFDSEDAADAPSAGLLDALAELDEVAPNFTDDSAISRRVHAGIAGDVDLRHVAVFVRTINGVVTLRGIVRSDAARITMVEIARGVAGVRAVDDQLVVDERLS